MAAPDPPSSPPRPAGGSPALARRKLVAAAFVLTLFGGLLVMPPLVLLFHFEARLFGLPLEVLYLFSAWALMILGARLLAPRLPDADRTGESEGETR